MTTKLTRRTALAGAVTLPLAPLGALANVQTADMPAEEDPFVVAFCKWVDAERACLKAGREIGPGEDDTHLFELLDAAFEARLEMCDTVPTTLQGIYLMISSLVPMFGELRDDAPSDNPFDIDNMHVEERWAENANERFLRALLAGAENVLNGGSV